MWTILTYNWMQYIYISKTCCNLIRWQLRLLCQQQKPLEVLETTPRTRYGWQPWEWAGLYYCWPVVMSLSKRAAAGKLTWSHISPHLKNYKNIFIKKKIYLLFDCFCICSSASGLSSLGGSGGPLNVSSPRTSDPAANDKPEQKKKPKKARSKQKIICS